MKNVKNQIFLEKKTFSLGKNIISIINTKNGTFKPTKINMLAVELKLPSQKHHTA